MKKKDELAKQVTTLLGAKKESPLSTAQIARQLQIRGNARKSLDRTLAELVRRGEIVSMRGNRFGLGEEADLLTGTLTVLRSGNGFVEGGGQSMFVGSRDQSTALPGDRVIARLEPKQPGDDPRPSGKIIRILERARHDIVGTLRTTGKFLYVVPIDPAYGKDFYVPGDGGAKIDDRVICRFTNWEHKHVNPEGEIIESLGSAEDPSQDTIAIIKHFGLPEAFPGDVVQEAEHVSGLMDQAGEREDIRATFVLTIDPVRSRDFDDALSLEVRGDGARVLGVHIADVSHFVRPGSALDEEAARRGNSVYLPDQVLPMLPEQLSNGVCSLRPDEDRLAFSAFLTLDAHGAVVESRFARTVMRSRLRLTYEQALALLEKRDKDLDIPIPDQARRLLAALNDIAQRLRQQRFARHALELDMPESEIFMGKDGRVEDIRLVSNDISHQLIEECMVAANEAVARELALKKVPLISRLHEPPKPEKIEELTILLTTMGFTPGALNVPRNLARFLRDVEGHPLATQVRVAVLRSMNRAVYSATDNGHFGLAKVHYTHFTSPIRRYTDLVVHRQLSQLLATGKGGVGYGRDELESIAEHCTATEQAADEAERALEEIKKYRFLEQQLQEKRPETFDAVVVSVMNFGVFVEIQRLALQGLVHVSALSNRFLHYNRATQSLGSGKSAFKIGTKLRVVPARVDFDKRQVDFVPA